MRDDHAPYPRHSRESVTSRLRLRDHDYSSASTYFVTICVLDRSCLFGEVDAGQMVVNDAGVVIDSWWHSLPRRFPGVWLDMMVVMPNHLHGIIALSADPMHDAEDSPNHTLGDVIGWFKNRTINDYGLGVRTFGWPRYNGELWQSSYYDHIVRSESALARIREYIFANPSQWEDDEENPDRQHR